MVYTGIWCVLLVGYNLADGNQQNNSHSYWNRIMPKTKMNFNGFYGNYKNFCDGFYWVLLLFFSRVTILILCCTLLTILSWSLTLQIKIANQIAIGQNKSHSPNLKQLIKVLLGILEYIIYFSLLIGSFCLCHSRLKEGCLKSRLNSMLNVTRVCFWVKFHVFPTLSSMISPLRLFAH